MHEASVGFAGKAVGLGSQPGPFSPSRRSVRPTTDIYSLYQEQDESYFHLPFEQMDLAIWAFNQAVPAEELAQRLRISEERAGNIYHDIVKKLDTSQDEGLIEDASWLLYEQALLIEGVELKKPVSFVKRLNRFVAQAL